MKINEKTLKDIADLLQQEELRQAEEVNIDKASDSRLMDFARQMDAEQGNKKRKGGLAKLADGFNSIFAGKSAASLGLVSKNGKDWDDGSTSEQGLNEDSTSEQGLNEDFTSEHSSADGSVSKTEKTK